MSPFNAFIYAFNFIFGSIIGSFLGVVAERLLSGGSLLWPPSHCTHCKRRLRPWELVPIVSFLLLRGRCGSCKAPIGWRLFFMEAASGLLACGLYWQFGWTREFFWLGILAALLLVISEIDVQEFWIPDVLSLPGLALGLASGCLRPLGFAGALGGAAVGAPLLLLSLVYPKGMGGGDGKLLAMIGAFLGWQGALCTLFLGSLYGSALGLCLLASGKLKRGSPLAFGPFLALGALSWIFAQRWLETFLPF
jgi:leader peptidase (prepilin peptidase)/N-methyltransferase